jgi:CHAT domain-containing protein/tetratricopeptide (TPR) repeat protein
MIEKTSFGQKLKNAFKRIYRKRSLILAVLLFILSGISPVIAKVPSAIPILQAEQNAEQPINKAIKLYRAGQFADAAKAWQLAAKVFFAQGDKLNQAMALSNLSLTYQQLGEWEPAKKAIADSLEVLKNQPESQEKLKVQAQTLDIHGSLLREIGESADALDTWQQSTKIYNQIGERAKVTQSKINQAQALQDLGLYPRACKTLLEDLNQEIPGPKSCQEFGQLTTQQLTERLQKVQNQPASLPLVLKLKSLGELLSLVGQPRQSEMILATSLNLAKKLNSSEDLAAIYLSIGNTNQILAEPQKERIRTLQENYDQKALEAYSEVIKLSESPTTRQQAQLNKLSQLLKVQEFSEAGNLWRSLNSQLSNLPPSRTGIYQQINFAESLVKLAKTDNFQLKADSKLPTFNDIAGILNKAAAQAKTLGDKRAEAYALGNLGGLYELSGSMQDLSKAEEFTKQSLAIASNFAAPDVSYQFFWQLGRIGYKKGEIENAIAAYTKSYDALQSLRGDLVANNPEIQFYFKESVEPIYRELVDLDLQYVTALKKSKAANNDKENDKDKNKTQQLLNQARTVIESLQLAELNNFFRQACVEANPKQIDKIDPTAAVIYPILLKDRLEVILSLPNQPLSLYPPRKIERQDFETTVQKVQDSLKSRDSLVEGFLPEYQKLYGWLIQPLETELEKSQVKNLVFVLDGDLRNIPMSILHDGNKYLIEKYAIAITSGLQLVDPKPLADINLRALTAGLSKVPKEFAGQFKPLKDVEEELQQIEKSGISYLPLLNDKFTSTELTKEINASGFPIVHLATHGQFSSIAEKTFILSWDKRINVIDFGNLLRNNTLNQGRPIELLVLSACETASGDNRAALGLAGVAVRAGARSTLATLWAVEDRSTAQIMGELYRQLEQAKKQKLNKAQVLQKSQLSLLKDEKNKEYNHPHFWAPFVLVGNWQ